MSRGVIHDPYVIVCTSWAQWASRHNMLHGICVINENPENPTQFRWAMMNKEIEKVKEYKYLGVVIENKGLEKENNMIRTKAERQFGIMNAQMHLRVNKYETTRGLWKGVAVPTIMYGAEIIDIGAKEVQGLEVVQNKAARVGLRANRYAPTETLRGDMGWSSFEERVDKAKTKYRMRLEVMEENRWPKRVLQWTQRKSKTIKDTNRRLKKLDMTIRKEGDREVIKVGERVIQRNEKTINVHIEKLAKQKGLEKWKRGMERKESLTVYRNKEKPQRENGYDGTWQASLLFKARSNTLEVKERLNRWKGEDGLCEKCLRTGRNVPETLEHVITECTWYDNIRQDFSDQMSEKLGIEKWREWKEDNGGLKYILGFQNEEPSVVNETKKFLAKIWNRRKEVGNQEVAHADHPYGRALY